VQASVGSDSEFGNLNGKSLKRNCQPTSNIKNYEFLDGVAGGQRQRRISPNLNDWLKNIR